MRDSAAMDHVADELLDLAGGDPFLAVREASERHQREHGCGLHHAGGPQLHLVASLARAAGATRALDLGCGLGYSTLWIASALGEGGSVIGIDDDPQHTALAAELAGATDLADRVAYRTGRAADVLPQLDGPYDLIHDDAWFATAPDHLDAVIARLRPGGLLTMVNWFLLVDAITGEPRNDWASFAGPNWADDTRAYAEQLAARTDLDVTWVTTPPIAFATRL